MVFFSSSVLTRMVARLLRILSLVTLPVTLVAGQSLKPERFVRLISRPFSA